MGLLYDSYAELAAAEVEGVDYLRTLVSPQDGSDGCIIAIHGGGIEAGTGEVAMTAGTGLVHYYEFDGIKSSGNLDLHITSTLFDEPICVGMVASTRRLISLHGFVGDTGVAETAIGGLDVVLRERVRAGLESAGFVVVDATEEIDGDDPANICNRNLTGMGVQLEISRAQREAFFPGGSTSKATRDNLTARTDAFHDYVAVLRSAMFSAPPLPPAPGLPSLTPVAERPQSVTYSYIPVVYRNGDPTAIGPPLPLSGVQYSEIMRGVGELSASLQLADLTVRALRPWELIYPRKTGIVVVRTSRDSLGVETHEPVWHGTVWARPAQSATGRYEIKAQTVESLWARRLITGPPRDPGWVPTNEDPGELAWSQVDQANVVADMLDPAEFSQLGTGAGVYPGWITVDPPANLTGVLRDFAYRRNQQTNLLEAHQDRSLIRNGYEWRTSVRLLAGESALDPSAVFRCQFILGYPRLGRQYGVDRIPRVSFHVDGRGNALAPSYTFDGSSVANAVWGNGSGYDDSTVRALSTYSAEWDNGLLITEARYSNPDVRVQSTLQDYTNKYLVQTLVNERFIDDVTVRGDLEPHFGTYSIGDDMLFVSDDVTQENGDTAYLSRIMGWKVTPPEGKKAERIALILNGGQVTVNG